MKLKFLLIGILIVVIAGIIYINYFAYCNPSSIDVGKALTDNDLKEEMKNLGKCNAYPNNQEINQYNYPRILGTYSRNGLTLVERYFCSDVCPAYGRVSIVFENITSKEKCAEADGRDLIDLAWGGYMGCAPKLE